MWSFVKTNNWMVLVAMAAALSMVFIDQSAIPVALPQMQQAINASDLELQWIVNAYLLALATLVIFGGKIGDVLGHHKVFLWGITIFIIGSVACGVAESSYGAIASRALQGIGGAFMIPSSGVIIINTFKPHERGKAVGIYIGSASVFLSLGPILGGVITQYLGWRWVFWINIPLAFLSIVLTIIRENNTEKHQKSQLDWLGFFTLSLAMFTLVFAFMEANSLGWSSYIILGAFLVGIVSLFLFINVEKHVVNPLIDLTFFKNKISLISVMLLAIIQIAAISVVFIAIFLQNVLGYSAAAGGLMLLPILIPVTLISPIAGKLFDIYGPRTPIKLGTLLLGFSVIWIAIFAPYKNYLYLLPALIFYGCSMPLIISSAISATVIFTEPKKRGMASGIASGARQVGGAFGLAIIGSVISNVSSFKLHKLSSGDLVVLKSATLQAYTSGFSFGMYTIAAFAVIGFILSRQLPSKMPEISFQESAAFQEEKSNMILQGDKQ